ncbi:MAG: hypothetical protein QGF78_04760 [Candidatus Bathyarchaeota archaeon]|nr:hypothetical protein [Candidatus Bathyarchaeota archaeon]
MSEKEFTPCPICKPIVDDGDCIFTMVRSVEGGKILTCCCPQQVKVKSRYKS